MSVHKMHSNGTDLRRSILDISRKMLVDYGYNGITMRKIANEAGCSATSIYLYFKNKDDLLHTLIDEGFELLYQKLMAEKGNTSPIDQLENISWSLMNFGMNNPEYYEIMFLIHPDQMERYPADKFRRARRPINILMEILEDGKQRGLFEVDDTFIESFVVWSSVHGAITATLAKRVDVSIPTDIFLKSVVERIKKRYMAVT